MSSVGNFTWKEPRGFLTQHLLTDTSFLLCASPLTCLSPNRTITPWVFLSQFYKHEVCFFPSEEGITHGRMLGNTDWVGDRGNRNPKRLSSRQICASDSQCCLMLGSQPWISIGKQKKNLIFFTWPVSLWGLEEPAHLHEGLLHTQACSDTPGLTPQQWWWLFAWTPRTPTCCKITFFIFNPLQYRITLVSVLLPVPWAYFLQLLCSFSSSGRWWQLFLRPVCSGYSTSSPN